MERTGIGESKSSRSAVNQVADIGRLQRGDEAEFVAYYERNFDSVRNFLIRIGATKEDAEQIANDSFLKYWDRRTDFSSLHTIKSFIFKCAQNAFGDFIDGKNSASKEQKRYEYLALQGEEFLINEQIRSETLAYIHSQIDHLPAQQQLIFRMIYFEGKDAMQIAEILGLQPSTVRTQHSRALKALRNTILEKGLRPWVLTTLLLCATFCQHD